MVRALALEIRSSRLGFSVFEAPDQLLDWGVRSIGARRCRPISDLLRMYTPSFVVVRGIRAGGRRDTLRAKDGMRAIRREARRRSIAVLSLSEAAVKRFVRAHNQRTKFETASDVAARFPELAWQLPRPRKCYDPENARVLIFDAVSLGVVFLALRVDELARRWPLEAESFRRPLGGVAR